MENMRKDLESLKKRFREFEDRKRLFFRDFGDFILEEPQSEAASGIDALADGLNRVKTMAEDRKTLENQVEEINRLIEEKKRLEDERKKGRSDIRDLEKANASLYENMGRAGFQAFREGILSEEKFGDIFMSLEEEKSKINTFEVELKKSDAREGGFFKKIMNRSREVYLKSNQNLRIRNLAKIFQKAGEALGDTEIPWEEHEYLKHAFLPYYKNREKLEGLSKRDDELARQENDLRNRMETLGIQRNSGKRLQDLADDMGFQDEKMSQEKTFLGQTWWTMDKKNRKLFKIPSNLEEAKNGLDGEEKRLIDDQKLLEREIRRKELSDKMAIQEKDAQRLKNRINQVSEELERKQAEIKDTLKELEDLSDEGK